MYSTIKMENTKSKLPQKKSKTNKMRETSFTVPIRVPELKISVPAPPSLERFNLKRLIINICGRLFEINEEILKQYPLSLLGNREERIKFYDQKRCEYYFDSSAQAFEGIFYFYHHNYIKCPIFVALEVFYDLLVHFGLLEYVTSENCDDDIMSIIYAKQEELLNVLRKDNPTQEFTNRYDFKSEIGQEVVEVVQDVQRGRIKQYVWNLFDKPHETLIGRIIGYICLITIGVSVLQLCLETYVDSIEKPEKINITYHGKPISLSAKTLCRNHRLYNDFTAIYKEVREGCKLLVERRISFVIVEIICNLIFTIELLLRFYVAKKVRSFFKEFSNLIDLLIVFPFWASFVGYLNQNDLASEGSVIKNGLAVLRLLRITRVLRILKLSQHLNVLKLIGSILSECVPDICILFTCMLTNIILFSSFIYYLELSMMEEQSSFISIPHAFWWAIISFTSVGYGDLIPLSRIGKLFGCVFVLFGMFIALLPVPILSAKFEKLYKELSKLNKKKKK